MKQRSASLDHSAHAHHRHLQHRATVTIRTPYIKTSGLKKHLLFDFYSESDDDIDDRSTIPSPLIDLNKFNLKRNTKFVCIKHFMYQ
jgi:hypothetical protein